MREPYEDVAGASLSHRRLLALLASSPSLPKVTEMKIIKLYHRRDEDHRFRQLSDEGHRDKGHRSSVD
ncbi:hypothetical protein U1Q18_017609 [Sarracenia purpurea var. burkii]